MQLLELNKFAQWVSILGLGGAHSDSRALNLAELTSTIPFPHMKALPLKLSAAILVVTMAVHGAESWTTDFKAAQAAAKKDGKPILIDFTGSDWCGWCIKMKKDSLDQAAFQEFAKKELVLVEADFPNKKEQTDEVKAQNKELQKKYNVEGYPTFVLIDANGKELGRQVGYLKGGPTEFVKVIQGWAAKK